MLGNIGQLPSVNSSVARGVLQSPLGERGVGYEESLATVVRSSLIYSIHESSQSSAPGSNSSDSTLEIRAK